MDTLSQTRSNLSYKELIQKPLLGWEFTERSKQGLDHFQIEEVDVFFWHDLGTAFPHLGFFGAGVYLLVILSLQKWMKNRPAFNLDKFFIFWNISMGIFSIVGFYRTFPGWWDVVKKEGGYYESICVRSGADGQLIFWVVLFVLSKFLECGDTLLLVLSKRTLHIPHLCHHLAIQMLCWTLAPYAEPVGRWLMVFNFAEHALMYPYFAVRALGIKTPNYVPNFITTFQLVMTNAVFVSDLLSIYFHLAGYDCYRHPFSIKVSFYFGFVFIMVFAYIFYKLVITKGRQKKEAQRKEEKKAKVI